MSTLPAEIENGDNTENAQFIEGEEEEDYDEENEEYPDEELVEKPFKFEDFAKRLLNPKIIRACAVVLTDWDQITTKSLKAAVTILHRIAVGCSCPAMLYQAKLFRIFQRVLSVERDAHHEELRRLGIYVVRKFVEVAPTNPKIYAELLFWKSVKEANELEGGYCDAYEPAKGVWTEEQEDQLRMLFEENQRNPETDKDVIDWILEHLSDKKRTRRMVLKKLKEMGLMFKAPTKRSTANAANKNLWRTEEDEELQSLYDQHRLEDDCLQRIIIEFSDRRTKRQIIQRLLQLHIIADKSEIMPKKQRKRKPKNKQGNLEFVNDEDEYMEEPQFSEFEPPSGGKTKSKKKRDKPKKNKNKLTAAPKPSKPVKRKIVRTPLDVGTVRALIQQVADKYQGSIDWLKECLDDAAEETEEPNEEDDGVPLVPLQEATREAMENGDFQKVLVALGIQPPVLGGETYWRIPVYLNAADLKLRAKIVAGENVDIDMEGIEDENADEDAEPEGEAEAEEASDNEEEDESSSESDSDDGAASKSSESEKDFFEDFAEKQKKRATAMDKFLEKRAQKMRSIMFNKSDEEDTERAGIGEKGKHQRKPKEKASKSGDSSEDEAEEVDKIKKKLDKRRRQIALSSDDEDEQIGKIFNKNNTSQSRAAEADKKADAVHDIFDQLKSQTNKRETREETTYTEELEELNFNSENYRRRLLELGDSGDEDTNANENMSSTGNNKTRMRRANVIESDSEDENENEKEDENAENGMIDVDKDAKDVSEDNKGVNKANAINDNDGTDDKEAATISAVDAAVDVDLGAGIVDKTSNQADVDSLTTGASDAGPVEEALVLPTAANKRKRAVLDDSDEAPAGQGVNDDDDDEDEDAFIVRRKPTKEEEQKRLSGGEEPTKRRRLAIIDDDEDDD
ncbi:protein timeless homolog [Anastrepha obliqua]|uniref:protein timeless homolog n=1 Tax=Anastrepha obliqua TaxID=95512 RepID=UPI002409F759|nr:protein timeless homolog [Anastrepha obliqua]